MAGNTKQQDNNQVLYVKFLGDNIKRTVAQTRTQLDELRPNFKQGNWAQVPQQLKQMNNLFARMDIILREVEKQSYVK